MPLYKGKENIGRNIKTEMEHGKSRAQAIAIALNVAGKSSHSKGTIKHNHPAYKR